MNPSSAISYWDFCFRTMLKCCYCQSFLCIHFYPNLELLDVLRWYVFAKLIYKDYLIYIPYNKGERETLSEVKTYRLVLEDCHSTGTLLKVWNMLQYCISAYSQIFIQKNMVRTAYFLMPYSKTSLVIPLPFKLHFVNKISQK